MEIITPILNRKVELKDWITGREQQEIMKPITDTKMTISSKGESSTEINIGEAQRKSTEKAIEFVVISIDGDKKDILNRVYDMPSKDYDFVVKKVDSIVKGDDFQQAE